MTRAIAPLTLSLLFAAAPAYAAKTLDEAVAAWAEVWSPKANAAAFSTDRLKSVYSTKNLSTYDTNLTEVSTLSSFDSYANTWVPWMQSSAYWTVVSTTIDEQQISKNLGYTAITFVTSDQPENTESRPLYTQHATLIWRRERSGDWRVIHEHISPAK